MTASAAFYTGSGVGTGAYNWNFNMNSPYLPFQAVTSGVTYIGLTPATYSAVGFGLLMKTSYYTLGLCYASVFEIDITPQSVTDSVVCTVTPSLISGNPSSIGTAMGKPWTKQQTFASGRVYRQGDYSFRSTVSLPDFFGLDRKVYESDTSGNYVFAPTANPVLNFPWVVNVNTGDNATLGAALEVRVRITYYVKCFGLANEDVFLDGQEQKQEVALHLATADFNEQPLRYHYFPNGRVLLLPKHAVLTETEMPTPKVGGFDVCNTN